jgi:hypothetical protein
MKLTGFVVLAKLLMSEKLSSVTCFLFEFSSVTVWLVRNWDRKESFDRLFCMVGDGWEAQLSLFCFSSSNVSFWVLF